MNMASSCLGVAFHPDYKPVWFNQEPLALSSELAEAQAAYTAALSKAAQADAADGGAVHVKALAQIELWDKAYLVTRALSFHFKRRGEVDRLSRVDLSRSSFRKLRKQRLVSRTTAIRDLAQGALGEPDATSRGLTVASVDALSAAITAYSNVLNLPRSQSVNQGTLLKESDQEAAALSERFRDLTDLVIQFGSTELGARFVEAWRRARIILDSGRPGSANAGTPATTVPSSGSPVVPPIAAAA